MLAAGIATAGILAVPSSHAAQQAAVQLRPVSWWEARYIEDSDYDNRYNLPLSRSKDSWDYYNLAYGLDDPVAMYLASGKPKYLDQALVYVDNVVNNARVSSSLGPRAYGDSYLGWVSHKNGSTGEEVPLYESYAWRYVTRLLLVVKQNLYDVPKYRTQYDRYLAFTERNIFDKWYNRGIDNLYRSNTNMSAHWAYISMDLSLMTTDPTRLARTRTVFHDIDASLHGKMRPNPVNPAGYYWNEVWGSDAPPGQDVSHGNNDLAYIVEAHDSNLSAWTDVDIGKFAVTLGTVIWPTDGGPYADFVDGSGKGNGWFIDGWMKLGRYDARLQQRFETHDVAHSHGNGALNAKLLGATG